MVRDSALAAGTYSTGPHRTVLYCTVLSRVIPIGTTIEIDAEMGLRSVENER